MSCHSFLKLLLVVKTQKYLHRLLHNTRAKLLYMGVYSSLLKSKFPTVTKNYFCRLPLADFMKKKKTGPCFVKKNWQSLQNQKVRKWSSGINTNFSNQQVSSKGLSTYDVSQFRRFSDPPPPLLSNRQQMPKKTYFFFGNRGPKKGGRGVQHLGKIPKKSRFFFWERP